MSNTPQSTNINIIAPLRPVFVESGIPRHLSKSISYIFILGAKCMYGTSLLNQILLRCSPLPGVVVTIKTLFTNNDPSLKAGQKSTIHCS
jgi:hypothetical protein